MKKKLISIKSHTERKTFATSVAKTKIKSVLKQKMQDNSERRWNTLREERELVGMN